MNHEFYDISTIESYLRGEMDESTRQAFEAQLSIDETLRREVEAYRSIFEGFRSLRQERFATSVAAWLEEAKATQGRVVPMSKGATLRTLYRKVALAASVVLLLGLAAGWWMSQQYTNTKLVTAVYSPPLTSGTMGAQAQQENEIEKQFELGHQLFQQTKYREAAQHFDRVVLWIEGNPEAFDKLTRKFLQENSLWMRLLARFASGQLSEEQFAMELDRIAADPANEYAPKAKALLKQLQSFWRKWAR